MSPSAACGRQEVWRHSSRMGSVSRRRPRWAPSPGCRGGCAACMTAVRRAGSPCESPDWLPSSPGAASRAVPSHLAPPARPATSPPAGRCPCDARARTGFAARRPYGARAPAARPPA
eukprot:6752623-Prymnesium_polylepis.3